MPIRQGAYYWLTKEAFVKTREFKAVSEQTEIYPADWEKYGRAAGPKRNKKIAEISDYIICFWDGKSIGTKSLLSFAEKYGKPVKIKLIKSFS